MARRKTRLTWRMVVLMLLLAVGAGAVVVRLVQVQILDHGYYAAQAKDEHLHQVTIREPRGAILDRNGYPLATTIATFDVYIDPRTWDDAQLAFEAATELAPMLATEPVELLQGVAEQEQGDYLAARSVDASVGLKIMEKQPPGVRAVETSKRFYPESDLASEVLGFVGRDEVGLAGVEASFDIELGGEPGVLYFERDGLGNPIPFGRRIVERPVEGGDVRLTIDRYIQGVVEERLAAEVEQHGATGGSIIVMDPDTGAILAMASQPTFEVTDLDLESAGEERFRNRAVMDLYSPGSVMKTITMAAAIDLGLVAPGTTYFDDGTAEIEGGEVIENWDFSAHGTTTMREVLQFSLNTGAVWVANVLGPDRFYQYMERFGFGSPTYVGLGGEPAGIVRTHREEGWYPIDLATNSFGQGISVTPLQMVTAVAALVNGGELMRPYVVKEVTGPDGHRVFEPVVVQRAVSEETSRTLVEMMGAVVDGMPGHLGQVPGYSAGGKTGTTTFPDRATTIASFVGFAPREDPRIIMLVKIDEPKDSPLGGVVAAPIFADLAPHILSYLDARPNEALVERAGP